MSFQIFFHNLLKAHKANITGYNDGIAASIASVILMSADEIIMPANSITMIHDPFGFVQGTSEDMAKMAEALDKIKDGLITAYENKTGMSKEELSKLMTDETWLTADEALEMGRCPRIWYEGIKCQII